MRSIKAFKIIICVFSLILFFALGGAVGQATLEQKVVEVEVPVEVIVESLPVIEYVDRLEVRTETFTVYEEIYPEPREFQSVKELKTWLSTVKLWYDHEYKETYYDCDDFTTDMVKEAISDGYVMGIYWHKYKWHYECWTPIDGKMWLVEPQNNSIKYIDTLD